MCVVSMVIDHKYDEWERLIRPRPSIPVHPRSVPVPIATPPYITKEEIEEFRRLLDRAREYDKRNNEPDCEMEEKKRKLLKLADELGIKIDFV